VALIGLVLTLAAALGCRKSEDRRKPRVDLMVMLDPTDADARSAPRDAIAVATANPPKERQMLERSGLHIAVVGIPTDVDPIPLLVNAVADAERAGSNGTIIVTKRCLKDLLPAVQKDLAWFWTVPLILGARCEGNPKSWLGASAWVEVGSASRVRIVFDRHTRGFLKVEPIP
jgi:hypothetical protein